MARASRISAKFRELQREHRKGLIPFLVAGYPDLKTTERLLLTMESAGADIIELGIPFSDPMADGPVIQRAYETALKKGVTLRKILRLVASVRRKGSQTPIVLMGYFNPILAYGLKAFARAAATAGVDGLLVVDLPPEESAPLDRELRKKGVDLISLIAPTSDAARVRLVARKARGYIYYVSMTGITGSRLGDLREVKRKVVEIRRHTALPVVVGFGIRKPTEASSLAKFSDGVVIGSELVRVIEKARDPVRGVASFISRFVRRGS